jgi:type I restriction enzyme, S subunit
VQLRPDVPRSLIRFWFQSLSFRIQAAAATSGDSAQPTLGLGDLKNFGVGVPPDQSHWQTLASQLEQYRRRIDDSITRLDCQINLLVEHRQALITAAVTGQLDLPGAVA